ncbi:MAG: hypothetical protein M3P24_07290 [Gemmatimonadota bacterium]|nr:hypothetical protein [Gemmatimonadota bacterium]
MSTPPPGRWSEVGDALNEDAKAVKGSRVGEVGEHRSFWAFDKFARSGGAGYFELPQSVYLIDVAATLLNGEQVFGECKWWPKPMGQNVLDRLRETSGRIPYRRSESLPYYLLFTRTGFTSGLEEAAGANPRLLLLGPEMLVGAA